MSNLAISLCDVTIVVYLTPHVSYKQLKGEFVCVCVCVCVCVFYCLHTSKFPADAASWGRIHQGQGKLSPSEIDRLCK